MKNWSTDVVKLQKNSTAFRVWQLEQKVNFGLDEGEKINEQELRKNFNRLQIDPDRKKLFELLLSPKTYLSILVFLKEIKYAFNLS